MPQKGPGSHEKAIPAKHSPTKNPATGVRNPAASPPRSLSTLLRLAIWLRGIGRTRQIEKLLRDRRGKPTAARNRSSPMPGLPRETWKYSLLQRGSPWRANEKTHHGHYSRRYASRQGRWNPTFRNLFIPFSGYLFLLALLLKLDNSAAEADRHCLRAIICPELIHDVLDGTFTVSP